MVDDNFFDELDDTPEAQKPQPQDSGSEDELEDGLDDSLDDIQEQKAQKPEEKKKVESLPANRRTYKISITYDFYYNTPRLWIQGSDSKNKPLTEAEIYEDIMSDYKGKTVTMEKHPHLGEGYTLEDIRRLTGRADDGFAAPLQAQSRDQDADR